MNAKEKAQRRMSDMLRRGDWMEITRKTMKNDRDAIARIRAALAQATDAKDTQDWERVKTFLKLAGEAVTEHQRDLDAKRA